MASRYPNADHPDNRRGYCDAQSEQITQRYLMSEFRR